jgi:hypothetical protein
VAGLYIVAIPYNDMQSALVVLGVICRTMEIEQAIHGLFRHLPSGTVQCTSPLSSDIWAMKPVAVSAAGVG